MDLELETFLAHPGFSNLDRHFARGIAACADPASKLSAAAAALLSMMLERGHDCLDLGQHPALADLESPLLSPWPEREHWRKDLLAGKLVTVDEHSFLPMVLDSHDRLYLHRYFEYELGLANAIARRANRACPLCAAGEIEKALARHFSEPDDQARAAALRAANSALTVLCGAPGTGKTTAVLKIVAVLLSLSPDLDIALLAPTGKAAKRMEESIGAALDGAVEGASGAVAVAPDSATTRAAAVTTVEGGQTVVIALPEPLRARIPRRASTIHRLLGPRGDSPFFRHDVSNPLAADVVVVDESSMVDLPLMAKLFDALREDARVILLGDANQLASVEMGSVLSDIVESFAGSGPVVVLRKNYRFARDSGIRHLCEAICEGRGDEALDILGDGAFPDVKLSPLPGSESFLDELKQSPVVDEYRAALSAATPAGILGAMGRARILCAVREGPLGVGAVNQCVESLLRAEGIVGAPGHLCDRRPVVVLRNDYSVNLFNGDLGVILENPEDHRLYAHFQYRNDSNSSLPASRLPEHEPAFAMTVHRSQGSEFDHVLLVIPPGHRPILTRELLYTAVSRARKSVNVWAEPESIVWSCRRKVERSSGLADRLAEAMKS